MSKNHSQQPYESQLYFTKYPHAYTRVIRRLLPPNAQLLYMSFLEQMFGYHKPEGQSIRLTYAQLRTETGIVSDRTIRTSLLLLEALVLITRNGAGYTLNVDLLRTINGWLSSGYDRAYMSYISWTEEHMDSKADSLIIKEGSLIIKEQILQKLKNVSLIIKESKRWSMGDGGNDSTDSQLLQNLLKDISKIKEKEKIKIKGGFLEKLLQADREEQEDLLTRCRSKNPEVRQIVIKLLKEFEGMNAL